MQCNKRGVSWYPGNQWDIASSTKTDFLYVMKVTNLGLLPNTTQMKPYVMFTPFDRRPAPRANHGGHFTVKKANPNHQAQIVKVKVYCLLFHFLRACHKYQFQSPINSQQGITYLREAFEVFTAMEEHPDVLGGIRVEATISAKLGKFFKTNSPTTSDNFSIQQQLQFERCQRLAIWCSEGNCLKKLKLNFD